MDKRKRKKVSEEDFILVCEFLAREGYLDDDWWSENPTAIERYRRVYGFRKA